jgi:hypothetical protein
MSDITLKDWVANIFIITRFLVLMTLGSFYFLGGFTQDEITPLLAIMLPVSAAYFGTSFNYLLAHPKESSSSKCLSKITIIYAIFLPVIYSAYIIAMLTAKAFSYKVDFEQLKTALTAGDAFFGLGLSAIIKNLFTETNQSSKSGTS